MRGLNLLPDSEIQAVNPAIEVAQIVLSAFKKSFGFRWKTNPNILNLFIR